MKNKQKILVTKTFLPPIDDYVTYLKRIWKNRWITNHGELSLELEQKLAEYLDVKHAIFVTNGTVAIQFAIKALELDGEIITTPFSFAATTTSIIWEKCKPVFVDISPENYSIDVQKIEKAITKNTKAILAVHVYGYPSDVMGIEKIAKKHNLKVIYDAAHAFGVKIDGKSIFKFGDISTLSLHATKLFHSAEGGLITTENDELAAKLRLLRDFGLTNEGSVEAGINGKNSELHAAMGLVNLKHIDEIKINRKNIVNKYKKLLKGTGLHEVLYNKKTEYNNAYFPVLFRSETELLDVKKALEKEEIFPRRYFYPSLNTLPYVEYMPCPISETVASRVLCLPLYNDLKLSDVEKIVEVIKLSIIKKVPSIAVGIPAYNESANIVNLIQSIMSQVREGYYIKEIIINSDGSEDNTIQLVNDFAKLDKRIRIINNKERKGKAHRLNEIYKIHESDFLLTLDADIMLGRTDVISKMVKTFKDKDALVSAANFVPIKSHKFIGQIMYSNNILWNYTRESLNNGDHIANLYGGASMLRKDFSKTISYPEKITCDEEFLYIKAKEKNGFRFAKDAIILFKAPESIKEILLQGNRFYNERKMLIDIFGEKILSLHDIPIKIKMNAIFKTLLSGEFLILIAILMNVFLRVIPFEDDLNKNGMWKMAQSTKTLV